MSYFLCLTLSGCGIKYKIGYLHTYLSPCGCQQALHCLQTQWDRIPCWLCVSILSYLTLMGTYVIFNYQLDEKDGLAVSLKESSRLVEEAKEREVQMQNKFKIMEQQVQALNESDQEVSSVLTQPSFIPILIV